MIRSSTACFSLLTSLYIATRFTAKVSGMMAIPSHLRSRAVCAEDTSHSRRQREGGEKMQRDRERIQRHRDRETGRKNIQRERERVRKNIHNEREKRKTHTEKNKHTEKKQSERERERARKGRARQTHRCTATNRHKLVLAFRLLS